MKRILLASVTAVSFFAATSIAVAQNGQGNASGQSGVNQKADPASGMPSPATPSPKGTSNAAPPAQTQSPAMRNSASGSASGEVKSSSGMKADTGTSDAKPSARGSASGSATTPSATTDTKPSTNTATDTNRSGSTATDTKSPAASTTTGAAPSAGVAAAAPPAEKRSQILSVIKTERVEPVTNVNFSISIGSRVPSTVRYYPVPARVVEIYPEWRGYYFILVNGRYVILRPQTYEIVYILDV